MSLADARFWADGWYNATNDLTVLECQKMYIAPQHGETFALHGLTSFEEIWQTEIDWFEAPNQRRGGWSGVGQLSLVTRNGEQLRLFVKKQHNHGRLTFRHPYRGEPTFRREFNNLNFLRAHKLGVPSVVYYAEDLPGKRAILITEALQDFSDVESNEKKFQNQLSVRQKINFLRKLGGEVRRFHLTGLVHRALYPKHIFVRMVGDAPDVAFIDLEKARFTCWSWYRAYFDLAALYRHATGWTASQRMAFYHAYCGREQLSRWDKWLCRMILARARR